MTADELRAIMAWLRDRVEMETSADNLAVSFSTPTESEMTQAGLNAEGVRTILTAGWWDEMITDIVETPDFCEEDDSPEQILEYAKDVVSDYLRKRVEI